MISAYTTWEVPPSFLLIVGDADHVPVSYQYSTGTDLWYTAIDGTDYLPDINGARISVDNETELSNAVNKILDYSKTPYTGTNWFNNILLAAYQESGRYFIYTSERIYNYLTPLGYSCNRQYSGSTPPGSTAGVIAAMNTGVAIANHRDHGASQNDGYSYTGWSYPQFTTVDEQALTNGRMYGVMFSLNCDSGWFDGETDSGSGNWECLGEYGLRMASGGFTAVLCSSRVSYSGYNDEFCCGLYDAMWPNFDPNYPNGQSANPFNTTVWRTAQVMNYGKYWMYDKYIVPGGCAPYPWTPSASTSRTTFEEFNMHGDPSMEIRTAFPLPLSVTHPSGISGVPCTVNVSVGCNGSALPNALVCLSQPNGMYVRGLTDAAGVAVLTVNSMSMEPINIVVTSQNSLPYTAVIATNNPPETPDLQGPSSGKPNVAYNYTVNATDNDGDNVSYFIDWGDGTNTSWFGPYTSGVEVVKNHTWAKKGDYQVKAKAKDNTGESDWAYLAVKMPYIPRWITWLHDFIAQLLARLRALWSSFSPIFLNP